MSPRRLSTRSGLMRLMKTRRLKGMIPAPEWQIPYHRTAAVIQALRADARARTRGPCLGVARSPEGRPLPCHIHLRDRRPHLVELELRVQVRRERRAAVPHELLGLDERHAAPGEVRAVS